MNNLRYTMDRVLFLVMYVTRHSVGRVISSDTSAYIVGNGHTAVVYVKRHSFGRVI
jgi:hypothetical protein